MNKITLGAIGGGVILLLSESLALYTNTPKIIVYPLLIIGLSILVLSAIAFWKRLTDYDKSLNNTDKITEEK